MHSGDSPAARLRAARRWCSAPAPAATTWRRICTPRRGRHHRPARPDLRGEHRRGAKRLRASNEGMPLEDATCSPTSMPYPVLCAPTSSRRQRCARSTESCSTGLSARLQAHLRRGRHRLPDDVSAPRRRLLLRCRLLRPDHRRQIGLLQYGDIERFVAAGRAAARRHDDAGRPGGLATGYKTQQEVVRAAARRRSRRRIGPVWGFDEGGELRNMWSAPPGGTVVHRRQPCAVPDLLAVSGAADQRRSKKVC